jgi:8-oxo-dGTP pyrophosphatase MutT (NUDIX family)
VAPEILEFGTPIPGAVYVLRPGGYGVVFNRGGEVAVIATPKGCHLPGGGQEAGEGPEAAAIREAYEECGLRIRVLGLIGTADELVYAVEESTHFRKRCSFFRAELISQDGCGEPDHRLAWLTPEQAGIALCAGSQGWAVALACAGAE